MKKTLIVENEDIIVIASSKKKFDTSDYSSDDSIDFISNFIEYFLLDTYKIYCFDYFFKYIINKNCKYTQRIILFL